MINFQRLNLLNESIEDNIFISPHIDDKRCKAYENEK
jgi:hypothetical protein